MWRGRRQGGPGWDCWGGCWRRSIRGSGGRGRRSWELCGAGLGAAKDEFLTPGAGRKRWRKAWNRIGSGVREARKAARESDEAIKAEARLQAFALGAPGLQFLNHIVDRLTPLKLAAACEEAED